MTLIPSASLFALALLIGCGETAPEPQAAPVAPAVPPAAPQVVVSPSGAVGASNREMADIAFNMAMQAHETGDPDAAQIIPRAIAAYEASGPLDTDGLFHLAALQDAAGEHSLALFSAQQILAQRPTHLLALGISGEAAAAAGDAVAARGYYQRLLDAFDAEQGAVEEYGHHGALMPIYRDEATNFIAQ